jgi:hypothetical protein
MHGHGFQTMNMVCSQLYAQWNNKRRGGFQLMMHDADARRQTPGLQINNPGGVIL